MKGLIIEEHVWFERFPNARLVYTTKEERSVGLLAQQKILTPRHDKESSIWQPIDAKWQTELRANYDLALPINIDSYDLLRTPVGEPKMLIMPTWRLAHR